MSHAQLHHHSSQHLPAFNLSTLTLTNRHIGSESNVGATVFTTDGIGQHRIDADLNDNHKDGFRGSSAVADEFSV
jgi:hypothetical protein